MPKRPGTANRRPRRQSALRRVLAGHNRVKGRMTASARSKKWKI